MVKTDKDVSEEQRSLVRVDVDTCERLARHISSQTIPLDRENSSLEGFSRDEAANFYLLLVAICHQTSPRGRPPLEGQVRGQMLRGWDYMSAKLEAAVQSDRSLVTPEKWASLSLGEFKDLFRDPVVGDRIQDPETRVELIHDLGKLMLVRRWQSIDEVYHLCKGRAATGDPNLFCLLSQFWAYRDPVRKKSSFFLSLMRNSSLWTYPDNDRVGPPVDYHEVRGHLRIGTVIVTDPELSKKLLSGKSVTPHEDVLIRSAVYEAIMFLSEETGLRNPSQLHYLFWNVFRSHCLRENPLCRLPALSLPERYQHLTVFGDNCCCPFFHMCKSASLTSRYYEHVFETDFY